MDLEDLITATDAAKLAGVERDTFTSYVNRGQAPAAVATVAGRRLYDRKAITAWAKNRPGQGRRMDVERVRAEAEKKAAPKKTVRAKRIKS